MVMNAQIQEIWNKFRSDLKIKIGNEKYERWGDLLILNDFESNNRKIVINCGNTYLYRSAQKHHDLMKDILEDGTDLVLKQVSGAGLKKIGQFTVPSPQPSTLKSEKKFKKKDKQIELPKCFDGQWIMPAIFARSPIFGIVENGKRRYLENEVIISWSGYEIRFTGLQLTQHDLDVWLEAFCRALKNNNYSFEYATYDFLKAIGKLNSGKNSNLLDKSFTSLSTCYVEIRTDDVLIYAGKLIDEYRRGRGKVKSKVAINPDIIRLFGKDYVVINRSFRQGLKTNFQKWQYNYISSQRATPKDPHRINLENIQPLTGSIDSNLRRFRVKFKSAGLSFTEITSVCDINKNIWTFVRK